MHKIARLSLSGISIIAFTAMAHAHDGAAVAGQEGVPQASRDVGSSADIIVTARRRDEALQDVPLVVNAVTSEATAKLNFRRFEDITAIVPGLNVAASRTSAGSPTTLRGVDFQSGVSGSNTTVGYYFNDAVASPGSVTFQMFDIAQVEVLRGPQGTLRGRSTPSGSINFRTHAPNLSEIGGYASGSIYSYNGHNLNGAINIPVVQDKLAVRVAGLTAQDSGDTTRAATNSFSPLSRTDSVRASVSADPFAGILLLDFTYQNQLRTQRIYEQVESANQSAQVLGVNPNFGPSPIAIAAKDRRGVEGFASENRFRSEIFNWQARLNLLGQSLTYVGIHLNEKFNSSDPQDKAGVLAIDSAPNGIRFEGSNFTPNKQTAHEIRLQNEERVAGIFDYVIGGLFNRTNAAPAFTQATGETAPAPLRLVTVRQIPGQGHTTTDEQSFFGNVTAHLGESTELSGGLRAISYKSHNDLAFNGTIIPAYTVDLDLNHTIYSASIQHRFSEQLMIYASTGSSFRPNGIAIGGPTAPSPLQTQFLTTPPETSKSYEIGVRAAMFDKRLTLNVTAFRQDFTNYPFRSPTAVLAVDAARNSVRGFNYVSGVPVRVQGVETEFSARPVTGLTLGGVLSYADGKIRGGVVPCFDQNRDGVPDVVTAVPTAVALTAAYGGEFIASCRSNAAANTAPKWSGALTSEYSTPITNRVNGFARGLYSWFGSTDNDPANAYDRVKSYGILNLYVGLHDPDNGWELSFYGKNITNTFRVLTRSNGPVATVTTAAAISSTNYFGITTTQPREFGVIARFAFGSR